jgi:hypothetical protein
MFVKRFLGPLIFSFAISGITFASSISVNGTCEVGTCNTSDIIPVNGSTSVPFSFIYTFANTDQYHAVGTVASFSTPTLVEISAANITLTYLGNSSSTASAADTLVIDFTQYFNTNSSSGSNNSGFEFISGDFTGNYAGASSVSAQGFTNGGTAMALMGPFSPPDPFADSRSNQPFAFGPVTLFDFRDTVVFGAGSGVGATITLSNTPTTPSAVPEPATSLYLATGLLFLFLTPRLLIWKRNAP